jgi:nucleoside-diphosphate-sugar epimerase
MEYMAKLWMDRLPITITRPFNYTGVGQNPFFLVPKIVQHCREKQATIELGNLDVGRDFSDVRDVAAVYATLAEHPMAGEVLNICSGQCHQLNEVVAMAQSISPAHLEGASRPESGAGQRSQRASGRYHQACAANGRPTTPRFVLDIAVDAE